MQRIILLPILFIFGTLTVNSQVMNQTITDPKRDKEVLIDLINRDAFILPVFGEYYQQDYAIYRPDEAIVEQIAKFSGDISITIVLASWCGDSREQLPRFMKILDQVGFDFSRLKMIAVDSYKLGRQQDVSSLQIERVPTFVFFRDGQEIGRIIETPRDTLEADMLEIISKSE
ncbi:MAG TPA: thioredoxin family protein [Bacteroidales bacterium]|nr:thioredoxin family protein [Bacteroidales bacterium]